ncbi:hypothetical protein PoB_002878400 [Plakobranchus ocellatus]|uniref:Uncharacterized protein n=1 Tax=Plakobranchus ocellatus TaxID=259542 RepID=A0AAV4A7S7_9GAST|nr:hypothetical protein PoB_002878400 [Plakobranchus ocellatus]
MTRDCQRLPDISSERASRETGQGTELLLSAAVVLYLGQREVFTCGRFPISKQKKFKNLRSVLTHCADVNGMCFYHRDDRNCCNVELVAAAIDRVNKNSTAIRTRISWDRAAFDANPTGTTNHQPGVAYALVYFRTGQRLMHTPDTTNHQPGVAYTLVISQRRLLLPSLRYVL